MLFTDTKGRLEMRLKTGQYISTNPLVGTTRTITQGDYKGESFGVIGWSPKGRPFLTLSGYYHIRFRGKLQWLEGQEMRTISKEA
jgi:hypothetical protein